MKKIYVAPASKVMEINAEELICQSPLGIVSDSKATNNSVLVRERGSRSVFILDDEDE